jgi:hypothetical protein
MIIGNEPENEFVSLDTIHVLNITATVGIIGENAKSPANKAGLSKSLR